MNHDNETTTQTEYGVDLEQLWAAAEIVHARNLVEDDCSSPADFEVEPYVMYGHPCAEQNVAAIRTEYLTSTGLHCGFNDGMITEVYWRLARGESMSDYLG